MPNHCDNELYVYGNKEAREEFAEFIREKPAPIPIDKSSWDEDQRLTSFRIPPEMCNVEYSDDEGPLSPFDFNQIIPYPEHFRRLDEAARAYEKEHGFFAEGRPRDGYNQGGYEWCRDNWDTKWNAYEIQTEMRKTSLFYRFDTAWSPPVRVIEACAKRFPGLKFKLKFWECGGGYKGHMTWKNGEKIDDKFSNEYRGNRGG